MIVTEGQDSGQGDVPINTLYYFPFSLYSLIVRFAFELGQSLKPDTSPHVRLRFVNLHRQENLTEEYLTLSPKGRLPAFSIGETESPGNLTESRDILNWLCQVQPELVPGEYRQDIESCLDAFYSFHAKPLAVSPEERSSDIPNKAAEMLERTDLSESHRRRLEIKSVYHDTLHGGAMNPENVQTIESQTREFLRGLSDLTQRHGRGEGAKYIFGSSPTILDAVATTFLARLMDMQRKDLVDGTVMEEYALGVMDTEPWRRTTHGRPTVWDVSLGDAADLDPL